MTYYQYPDGAVADFDFVPSGDCKKITAKAYKEAVRENAKAQLRKIFPPSSTVYTILKHVSSSGMSRRIDVIAHTETGPRKVSHLVADAAGFKTAKDGSLVVGGCGMDMGFHVAYSLSSALYRGGFGCIGKGCCSNDHSNGDRNYTPHYDGTPRTADEVGKDLKAHRHHHNDGGYALRHSWL